MQPQSQTIAWPIIKKTMNQDSLRSRQIFTLSEMWIRIERSVLLSATPKRRSIKTTGRCLNKKINGDVREVHAWSNRPIWPARKGSSPYVLDSLIGVMSRLCSYRSGLRQNRNRRLFLKLKGIS